MAGLEAHSVEVALGVKPLSELLDEREHLIGKIATLRAKYGAFGTFDHERKILLAKLKTTLRAAVLDNKAKLTDAAVDEKAHAEPEYVDFIIAATRDRAEWIKLEAQVEAIDYTINRGQAVLRLARENGL